MGGACKNCCYRLGTRYLVGWIGFKFADDERVRLLFGMLHVRLYDDEKLKPKLAGSC